jgi:hypothetical protein
MPAIAKFLRLPRADRGVLVQAAGLYAVVAVAVRVLPFGQVRRLLARAAGFGSRAAAGPEIDAHVVWAVRAVSSRLPGATCLTDALVAQCLLGRHRREAALCIGISPVRPDGQPLDAHAWLERGGSILIGAGAAVYDPLLPGSRCVPSPSSR